MKIYTRGGDRGYTSLIGGKRVPKNHPRIEAYGSMDELISVIGLLREMYNEPYYNDMLTHIQDRLMVASSILAVEEEDGMTGLPFLEPDDIRKLELEIDRMEEKLPPLRNFILPGGDKAVAVCHIARTTCRRVERNCTGLGPGKRLEDIVIYLNRLSDFLFVLSRYISKEKNIKEIPWKPGL